MSAPEQNHDGRISTPAAASSEPKAPPHSSDYAPYPKLDPNEVTPPPPAPISGDAATTMPPEFNPYVSPSPAPKSELLFHIQFRILSSFCVWLVDFGFGVDTMDSVKDTLGKWGKMAADATKKAEDLAGNVWQHCKLPFLASFFSL